MYDLEQQSPQELLDTITHAMDLLGLNLAERTQILEQICAYDSVDESVFEPK